MTVTQPCHHNAAPSLRFKLFLVFRGLLLFCFFSCSFSFVDIFLVKACPHLARMWPVPLNYWSALTNWSLVLGVLLLLPQLLPTLELFVLAHFIGVALVLTLPRHVQGLFAALVEADQKMRAVVAVSYRDFVPSHLLLSALHDGGLGRHGVRTKQGLNRNDERNRGYFGPRLRHKNEAAANTTTPHNHTNTQTAKGNHRRQKPRPKKKPRACNTPLRPRLSIQDRSFLLRPSNWCLSTVAVLRFFPTSVSTHRASVMSG